MVEGILRSEEFEPDPSLACEDSFPFSFDLSFWLPLTKFAKHNPDHLVDLDHLGRVPT